MAIMTTLRFVVVFLLLSPTSWAFAPINSNKVSPSPPTTTTLLKAATSLVWLTGHEDLRLQNHGGFQNALSEEENDDDKNPTTTIQPIFVLDPQIHLRCKSKAILTRLHQCLCSLEQDILASITTGAEEESSSTKKRMAPLIVKTGCASDILPKVAKEFKATSCHVIADDVVTDVRQSQRLTCQSLSNMGVKVQRWTNALRPSITTVPSFYPDYCQLLRSHDLTNFQKEKNAVKKDTVTTTTTNGGGSTTTTVVPSLQEFIELSQSATPTPVHEFRSSSRADTNTAEPFEEMVTRQFTSSDAAKSALEEYCSIGKDAFANQYYISPTTSGKRSSSSMYAASIARLMNDGNKASDVLALREVPTRTFTSAINMGSINTREILNAAHKKQTNGNSLLPTPEPPLWGRSSEGSLADVVEWREWFRLLANRSLRLQEEEKAGTSGGEKNQSGDPREPGTVHYWRWKDQYLVRYLTWPAGIDYDSSAQNASPAMLLVHGFAASAEQWERLVYRLRQEHTVDGKDCTPPIFAIDLLGFGHSEKPGLSYTQYLWEAQLVDFAVDVMEAQPMIMVGNSIGGGLSAGAAASLGSKICQGLVLCNTAGVLEDPDTYEGYTSTSDNNSNIRSFTEAALAGNPNEAPYSPIPLVGNNALDAFGTAIVKLIYPQIEQRLSIIYGHRMENADPAVVYAIQQSAMSPGSANVIGSGQKLAANRPLNEVLEGLNVLVVMGLDDRVSSPAVAQSRAVLFQKLRKYNENIVVEAIPDSGHCPHDETPELVANAMTRWLSTATMNSAADALTTTTKTAEQEQVSY